MGAKDAGDQVVRVGKNTKVSVVAERVASRVRERGFIEMETVGEGAVNQVVKAVAMARRQMEPEGYSLVIIPAVVEAPLGHGSYTVVHLTVVDWNDR